MHGPRPQEAPSSQVCAGIVIAMLAMLTVPAALTLHTVRSPAKLVLGPNPTRYGHTRSGTAQRG